MIASQFNLDHRLAELRASGNELRQAQVRPTAAQHRTVGAALRSLFGGANATGRPAGVAA